MELIKKNWWWIYSVVSGIAMVFYISSLLQLVRFTDSSLPKLSPQVIAMGAIGSALFYCIMRWPIKQRKSAYFFATIYALMLTCGAYIIQCYQFANRPLGEGNVFLGILLLTGCLAVFYSPQSIRSHWWMGLRKYYVIKPFIVAWCWTVWAMMPLLFIQADHLWGMMVTSLLFVFALVLITDIVDVSHDIKSKTMVTQWGKSKTIVLIFILVVSAEITLNITFENLHIKGSMLLAAGLPLMSLWLRKKYLTSLLVDGALILIYYFFWFGNQLID